MSDMKTFTVRDLDRSPGAVLEASRVDGSVRIRERGGQTYLITPEAPSNGAMKELPNFAARRARFGPKPLPPQVVRKLDGALASE